MTHNDIIRRVNLLQYGTKEEQKRYKICVAILKQTNNPGRWGIVQEIAWRRPRSKMMNVRPSNIPDNWIPYLTEKGYVKYQPTEDKHNGGRIEDLLNRESKVKIKFVRYSMDDVPVPQGKKARAEGRPVEYRNTALKVFPVDVFLAKLEELGATKPMYHHGIQDGIGIQVTKKAWFEWVNEWPIEYDEDQVFEAWMFEGLE